VEEVLRIAVPIVDDESAEDPPSQDNEPAPQWTKLGGRSMYVPQSREKVFIQGRPGTYVVLRVDHDKRFVDLIEIGGGAVGLEENVPFTVIRPFRKNLPMEER